MKKILSILLIILSANSIFAQFGQNKVQYKNFTWYYIQTDHFDVYFSEKGSNLAEFTSKAAEDALSSIQESFKYRINNRITFIIYNSTNDFQETNVTDSYLSEGIEGFTELFKNRVVIQFMGSYKKFRHLIHHELVHAVMNDMFYGGSAQNIISNNINLNIPLWFSEGMAEYQALGWDVDTDMFIRDAAINEYLPEMQYLGGYFAYRGGQSVFYYIAQKYGKEKIGEIINKIKGAGGVEEAFKESLGLNFEEFNERWKKDIKQRFWPDIAIHKDPDEFSKRLTDPKKDEGFYNISPALSPQGDKIAFLTNRNFFFDVYLMNAIDGKIIKRIVKGNRSSDFEELNILTPGLTWSPDGKKISLSAKSDGYDVIYIIDVEEEDRDLLPVKLDGIKSVQWAPDGKSLAFIGHTAKQSDVYIFDLEKNEYKNITNDIFSEVDPAWSADSKTIYFSSDRNDNLNSFAMPDSFKIYNFNYRQNDIYSINLDTKSITRITNLPFSDETAPVVGSNNNELLFISDMNGINNIYRKNISIDSSSIPVTNSLNGLYQLSLSKDGKKLAFSSFYQGSFNIFMLNNPFDIHLDSTKLSNTLYVQKVLKENAEEVNRPLIQRDSSVNKEIVKKNDEVKILTGSVLDSTKVYGDSVSIDFDNFVFGNKPGFYHNYEQDTNQVKITDNLDKAGNYKVNKYKITFSPDLIYANAGFNTLYGLQGTTVLSFSDVLGNHRLIGMTSLQIDLKNSDYGAAYFYLPNRVDFGIEAFHTARFVYLNRTLGENLFRFRNYGVNLSMSYPLNKFYRIDGGLSYINVSQENLDNSDEPINKANLIIPSVGFIHDNTLFGYTSPIEGTRYRFDVLGNPGVTDKDLSFYSILGDYRTYFRFWTDYSFAIRFSGGYSDGNNPQRFFLGGIENWVNRKFATGGIPLNTATDFAFLTAALPMRGFDYAERLGTKYSLMNLELRFPFIRYLITGGLPLFLSNVIGTAFVDMGAAWTDNKSLQFFTKDINNDIISKDLLMGTGVGLRTYFLYFLVRFDVAWAYDAQSFTKPKYYFSLGMDF